MTALRPAEHRTAPLVHGEWTRRWWDSASPLESIFGAHPADASLRAAADAAGRDPPSAWADSVHHPPARPVPAGALVVVAGQQPVLAGGALLVAHKAATAIRLARHLESQLLRPVVPLFLLADEDHDAGEVDHVDIIQRADGMLRRVRCPILPRGDGFYRCRWDDGSLGDAVLQVAGMTGPSDAPLKALLALPSSHGRVSGHVANLLHATFGHLGLLTLDAHALTPVGRHVLEDALVHPEAFAAELAAGAGRLGAAGLPVSFDPADRRPLVMESHGGKRRRVAAGDRAADRLRKAPDDFSPHAALRPLIQAAALPVVAQVCGPSELLYLGQARGLHARFGLHAPVLVPRLEATRLDALEVARLGGDLRRIDISGAATAGRLPLREEQELLRAAQAFARQVTELDAGLRARTGRWLASVEHGARRLAEAPVWRGRIRAETLQHVRPRGRWQDTVLAWLPDAWRTGRPESWAERIVDLCRPLQSPEHVLHVLPEEGSDG